MAAVDGPVDDLLAALDRALASLYGDGGLDAVLRRSGRVTTAERLRAGDRDAAWDLAAELNERRRL